MGKISPQGTTMITSWPELRESYKKGELPDDLLTGGQGDIPKDIVSYMKGETDILSERYAEPEYNINPDTQKVGHYRDPTDPKFTVGDVYDSGGNTGKKNVYHIRYDADNPANRGMISRKKSKMKSYGQKLQDYIQGDATGGGGSGYEMAGDYSEEELAGLYPDLQVGGDVGMSDFSQSVYRPSKKQIAEENRRKEDEIKIKKKKAEQKKFIDEGPVRLKLRKAELPTGSDRSLVGDIERGEYSDPDKPFAEFKRGGRQQDYRDLTGKRGRQARRQNRRQNFKALFDKNALAGQEKSKRSFGRFENLGEKRKYRKEEKLAKSTYGRGLEDMTGGELEAKKDFLKQERRDFLGAVGRSGIKALSAARETGKEIRDVRRAQKYSKMVGGPEAFSVSDRVNMGMLSKRQKESGPQYFKPERMQNFRSSKDNPLNRNSIAGFFNQNKTS
jgi:hypothetical protein